MISRIIVIYFFCLWSFGIHAEKIQETTIKIDKNLAQPLVKSLEGYLERYVGKEGDSRSVAAANRFLASLKFVSHAACRLGQKSGLRLICNVETKYYIKEVQIKNLPAGMLEEELKRKLPVQVGQLIIPNDKSLLETIEITKSRVETFLRKNGFYGAKISVSLHEKPESLSASLVVIIDGGSFARVNNVELEGNSPVTARAVRLTFKRMCFSFNRIFDAFSIGTIDCYSRELEREATKKLQDRLANMGYVQARISLTHRWLDPHDASVPKECRKKNREDLVPICVDLNVRIDKGPRVRWAINMREGTMVSRGGLSRFFGSIFAVDQLSRITRSLDDEIPPDQIIVKEELEKRINFIDTKNVAEAELTESAQKMREYLVSRGYTNAEVVPAYFVEDSENIVVNFDIYPGSSYYVKSYKIVPEYLTKYFEPNDLDNLFKVRGMLEPGQLSYARIAIAVDEIKRRLSERGFRDVEAKTEMISLDDGGIEVITYIASSRREFIDSITVINGEDKLNEEILPFLRNCSAVQLGQSTKAANLCQGSALDRENIINDEKKIADFYINNDFLFAKVRSELKEEINGYKIIFYIYDERFGPDATQALIRQEIKDVILSGNETVNAAVIKRLFPRASNGKRFDSISLKKGISALRESGRFSNVDYKIIVGQENSQDAYFAVHVTEKPSLILDSSLAFSTDQLLSVEAELEEDNLFHSMLRVNTTVGLGLFWGRQSSISNKFVWPLIFGAPFRFSLHAPIIIYDDKSSRAKPFRRLQSKVIAALEWRATPSLTPYLRYSLIHTLKQEDPVLAKNFQERLRTLDGLLPTLKEPGRIRGTLRPGISWINLDNPTDPHSGLNSDHWVEVSGGPFIGNPFFINVGTQNRVYVPLGPLTLALQGSLMRAFVEPNDDNWKELRDGSAMDSVGGDRSVRGYQEGLIGLRSSRGLADRFGGYLYNTANIELRFPLTSPEVLGNFAGAIFVDQGMVLPCKSLGCKQDMTFNEIVNDKGFGFSLGAGLRYNLPVGPIALDYGYSPIHNDWRIHVQFGYPF